MDERMTEPIAGLATLTAGAGISALGIFLLLVVAGGAKEWAALRMCGSEARAIGTRLLVLMGFALMAVGW